MKRSRLVATLLASLFALHLTVAGGLARAFQSDGMAGMDRMQAAPEAAMSMTSVVVGEPPSDEAPCPGELPCSMPGMPGHCPSALSCALAYSSTSGEVAFDVLLPLTAGVTSPQLPHTRTSPPELPPPRA
jgi:hypothetical protein